MDHPPSRRIGRSIWAIFAGFLVVFVLSLVTDSALYATGAAPRAQPMSPPLLALALAYRTIYAIFGSYITARLAPARPMLHAMVGGCIGFALGLLGVVLTWHSAEVEAARWYPIAVAIVAFPAAWVGGMLRVRQLRLPAE